jgi:hypothetical protein
MGNPPFFLHQYIIVFRLPYKFLVKREMTKKTKKMNYFFIFFMVNRLPSNYRTTVL